MKVSVIMPAYNAENFLATTLDSALGQTLDEYELIAVDDGSSDRTAAILDEYQKNHENMTVVHKENGGPSSARNTGIRLAKGEYCFFLDSDDILEPDSLECLYNRATELQADLVIAGYDFFNQYKVTEYHGLDDIIVLDDISRYEKKILWTFSPCNKLFSMSVIREYNIQFPPISYAEDGVFVLDFVYHCHKICGLDKVVFHYRKMNSEENDSITSSISAQKVRDYVTAHEMIREKMHESILRDHPEYESIADAAGSSLEFQEYFSEFDRKNAQLLVDQMYRRFWELEPDAVRLICDEVARLMEGSDLYTRQLIENSHRDLNLDRLLSDADQVRSSSLFTAVFFFNPEKDNMDRVKKTLMSLRKQLFVRLEILMPAFVKPYLEEENAVAANMSFLPADDQDAFYEEAFHYLRTPYVFFCEPGIYYLNSTVRQMYMKFLKSKADYFIRQLYYVDGDSSQAIFIHGAVLEKMRWVQQNSDYPEILADCFLGNKFLRSDFAKAVFEKTGRKTERVRFCKMLNDMGRYKIFLSEGVIFDGSEAEFPEFLDHDEGREFCRAFYESEPIRSLSDPAAVLNPAQTWTKLLEIPRESLYDTGKQRLLRAFEKLPVKNQVLFLTVRSNGEPEGNEKALYPFVKGRKIIRAKMAPFTEEWEIKTYLDICTSKVIVIDDYVRFLRHVRLKKEQRVIQLWHACGAFKKFGRWGTNLSRRMDMATHAQYSLVCVSGREVSRIYADAFGIEPGRVAALGTPRTDVFFDHTYSEKIRERILAKYPELSDRYVILYAPTFRDIGNDRTRFRPDLDFDRLSRELLPNQTLVICPHPVMKEPILSKSYGNIREIRDFSTNDFMFLSDMMLTDYSSVIFEYVLLGKPIAFYCYDLATYNRGFYLRYPEDLPGPVFQSQRDLETYLADETAHTTDERYRTFTDRYMSACDGHSSQRIADLINVYMGK